MRTMPVICLVLVSGACATNHRQPPPTPTVTAQPAGTDWGRASCARLGKGDIPLRVSEGREGSAVALVRAGQGPLLAYVADADSRSVHTVSVDEKREVSRTRVDGAPRQ